MSNIESGFHKRNGVLHIDNISLTNVAKKYATPCYVYSASVIRKQYKALKSALEQALPADKQPLLCYACKANSNIAIIKILKNLGSGLEIVSEGELARGLKAGFSGKQIISTSFGKSDAEIKACLKADILQFNIESPDELYSINTQAKNMGKTANVAFRLNPNISGGGHSKISTGRKDDKFGNTKEDILKLYEIAKEMQHLNPVGVSIHIGSQIVQSDAFKPGFERLADLVKTLRSAGHKVTHLDIGGGFPINYNNEILLNLNEYAKLVRDIILPLDTQIQMEPGRYMVGNAGILLTKVQYIKQTPSKKFAVLDAGMNDLIRPTLYDAYHDISPVIDHNKGKRIYDVVGHICESGDIFNKNHEIATLHKGDLVVIKSVGAYGFSMASNYNSRPLPAEILIDGNKICTIGKAQSIDELMIRENIPDWL